MLVKKWCLQTGSVGWIVKCISWTIHKEKQTDEAIQKLKLPKMRKRRMFWSSFTALSKES